LEILDLERIGPNVTGYVLYARYRLRLPFNKIKQSLSDLHNFHLSEGEISNQLEKAKEIFKEDYETVIELIRISDKVYCDETGWRVRGKNFWIWVFVTEEGVRYVIEDTRGKGVAEKALGDNENRVLISDFYAAYKNLPGENQYCWVHLLRDSKRSESVFHKDLKKAYAILKQELSKKLKERNYKRLDKLLGRISQKKYADENISLVQKLQKRIRKNKKELLTCLKYEGLLPENNTAERALRNSVVMRKIFGCSRSLKTAKIMEVNTSVIDTLLKQNPDKRFFEVILPKLRGETG
jgi:alpha-amylase/alpha-mannosidase (GH57 family)